MRKSHNLIVSQQRAIYGCKLYTIYRVHLPPFTSKQPGVVAGNKQSEAFAAVISFVHLVYSHHEHSKHLGREFIHGCGLGHNLTVNQFRSKQKKTGAEHAINSSRLLVGEETVQEKNKIYQCFVISTFNVEFLFRTQCSYLILTLTYSLFSCAFITYQYSYNLSEKMTSLAKRR